MKTILEYANNTNRIEYNVSLIDCVDKENLPITVTMYVDKQNQDYFEEYLENEQDNLFAHAEGGNIEY